VVLGNDDDVARRLGQALAEVPDARLAFPFGSRARGQGRANCDFDVAVLVDAPPADDGSALRPCSRDC
jgi:predicted nucleotidyltransferase